VQTLQALGVMGCYREDWPLLVVAPASMRLMLVVVVPLPDFYVFSWFVGKLAAVCQAKEAYVSISFDLP